MPALLPDTRRVRVREGRNGHELVVDGEVIGSAEPGHVSVGDLELDVVETGTRRALVDTRATRLRLDPHGGKATTLTLANRQYRLARQRWLPLRRSWVLREDVAGEVVLTVTTTPGGTRVAFEDDVELSDHDRSLLVAGALVVALGL